MNSLGNKKIMAANIRYYMNAMNVTQTDICKILNIAAPTFSDWVNAKTYPRIDKIERLANYFGISKSDLVEDHNQKTKIAMENLDPDIRRIERARKNMSKEDKERMMIILENSFYEYFSDDFEDEDTDE